MGDTPVFVLTHRPPAGSYPDVFTFVTDDVAAVIERARRTAGDDDIHLFGATVMQQALPLGLVDEIRLHVMPVLLGAGTALFDGLPHAIGLERIDAQITPVATHLQYRVLN